MGSLGLAERLAVMARALDGGSDMAAVLRLVVDVTVHEVPGARHASVTLLGRDGGSTPVFTDQLVASLDGLQYDAADGPCLVAAYAREVVRVDDLAADQRWPVFGPEAVRRGMASLLSFPLFVDAGGLGALNLYAPEAFAFPPQAERVGSPLAAHAAVAMAAARTAADLRTGMASRDTIGQAKGILMERHKISAQQAFTLLVHASQRTNIKLRDLAEHLALTGELLQPRCPTRRRRGEAMVREAGCLTSRT
jgi:GAF domain-containing protein